MNLREAEWSEERAQNEIASTPALLGIPESWNVSQERVQGGPRVDIAFRSEDGQSIVLVELQRGGADLSHLTKVLEYIHRERTAFPQADCRCIFIAESFRGKYGRLAEAAARLLPLTLMTMSVEDRTGRQHLVLRHHIPPPISEVAAVEEDHEAKWTGMKWYPLAQHLLKPIMDIDPDWSPKFNSGFIGGKKFGGKRNFIAIRGSNSKFHIELKLEESEEVRELLRRTSLKIEYRASGPYAGPRRRHYLVSIDADQSVHSLNPLHPLILRAYHRWETELQVA